MRDERYFIIVGKMRSKMTPIAMLIHASAPACSRPAPVCKVGAPHASQNRAPSRNGNPHARQYSVAPGAGVGAGVGVSAPLGVSGACCGVCESFGSLERSMVPHV